MTDSIPNHLSVEQAAAEIIRLINAKPTSPRADEIESIIARVEGEPVIYTCSACTHRALDEPQKFANFDEALDDDRRAWRRLIIALEKAIEKSDDNPNDAALEQIKDAAFDRLRAFERAIWSRPARTFADIAFLADLAVYQMWPGYSLTEEFPGNDPKTIQELIAEGAQCEGGTVDEAISALLKAIRNVLSPPRTPSPSDAALTKTVRSAIVAHMEAEAAYEKADGSKALAAACRDRARDLWAVLDQIPYPPRSPVHVLLHAEAAHHGSIKDDNGRLIENDTDDIFERPATRLVEAVLAWFGGIVR
jgi:hypothetical protein